MGWFTRDNDDDIDDIYNKLDDIYSKLEILDVVTAFSGRLSRLEKTSAYLEDVLMDTVKGLEKRVENLESSITMNDNTTNNLNVDNFKFQLDCLKDDITSLRKSLNGVINANDSFNSSNINQRINDIDGVIKNLTLKVSYLELAKDRSSNSNSSEVQALKDELLHKDEQINQLNKKIESLTYIIEEDNRNIKMVAKHIIDQANSMKALKEVVYNLSKSKDTSMQ